LLWRKIGSRFFMSLFPKTDKEASRKFCARFGEPVTPGSLYLPSTVIYKARARGQCHLIGCIAKIPVIRPGFFW